MKKHGFRRALSLMLCVGLLGAAMPAAQAADTPTTQEDEWEELSAVLADIYGEWKDTTYPGLFNNQIPNTALLGNGDIGITSGGDEVSKTFYISKSDFWQYNGSPLPIGGVTISAPPDGTVSAVSLARGAAVTSCCNHESFTADRVTSGQWSEGSGYEGWVSNVDTSHQHYITIDLGDEKTFDTILVRHDAAARPAETENVTKGFTLSVSNDADGNYETVYETTSNTDATTTVQLAQAVTARYLRLVITQPNQGNSDDSKNNPRARIGQVEVYDSATQDINAGSSAVLTDFYEKEDILNAQIDTTQTLNDQPVQMKTYTAAGSNLLITELTATGNAPVTLRATVWAKADDKNRPVTAQLVNDMPVVTRSTALQRTTDTSAYMSMAALALNVIGGDLRMGGADNDTGKAFVEFTVQPNETVSLVTAIGGGGQTHDNMGKLKAEIAPIDEATALLATVPDAAAVAALYEAHITWWKDYWLTSYILLDEDDAALQIIQRYYYAAQYFLGCMCNEDGVAPGLYGIWHTTDTPSWNGDYHLNYNFIATFYGLYSSGRVDLVKGAVQQILDYVPAAQKASESVAELRRLNSDFVDYKIEKGDIDPKTGIEGGLLFPVGIGPYGMMLDSSYHNQCLNATFSATMLINYYEYSGDEAFLEESLYDFLKGCITFYESWLEYDTETGVYTLYAGYNEGSWSINPAAELAMLKSSLSHLIQYSEQLGLDADRRDKWEDMLVNLADQPTTTYGGKTVYALAEQEYANGEWNAMANPVPGDGNIIPMESVQPAGVIGYYSADEELEIAKNTIDVFSSKGAWSQQNNFPKIFPIAVNVRYNPTTITNQLASVIRSQTVANLRISDNTHGAEKNGTTQAVNNMLVLSDQGVIKLFGSWQSNKSASFKRLCVAGGVSVSASYDGKRGEVSAASLTCETDSTLTVASLWTDMKVLDEDGNEVEATLGSAPNHPDEATYTFAVQAGKTYTFEKGEKASAEANKTELIAAVEAAITNLSGYTAASAAVYTEALENAQTVLADGNATQAQVDAAVTALAAATDALEKAGLLGDVNSDGKVNTADARLTLQYAAGRIGGDALDLSVADVDGSGKVNTADARLILQKAAGRIEKFPIE